MTGRGTSARRMVHVKPNVRVHVLAVVLALALFACFCMWLFDGLTCGGTGCR